MSEHQPQLAALFVEAFNMFAPKRLTPALDVRFYPYAGLNHTIRLRLGRIHVRIADIFADAPLETQRALAFILVAKLLRRKVPEVHNKTYRDFACTPDVLRRSDLARRRRGRKMLTSARGRTYDLEKLFTRVNRQYFDGELSKPQLSWSQRRTRRILGHMDAAYDTIVISRTLDSADVPQWFVEYILYHEMLHMKHPARIVNGRRLYHTKAFRLEEQRHPYYDDAQEWLDHIARRRRRDAEARRAA